MARIDWHKATNGITDKPKQTQRDVAAQMKGFASWHNANLKQKKGMR